MLKVNNASTIHTKNYRLKMWFCFALALLDSNFTGGEMLE